MCNSKAGFRIEANERSFQKKKDMLHGDAIQIEKRRCGTCFIENEKKEENLSTSCNEKGISALYWLCKEEVAHSKHVTGTSWFLRGRGSGDFLKAIN